MTYVERAESSLPRSIVAAFFTAIIAALTISGQTNGINLRALTVDVPIERELKGDELHSYSLALQAGQFLNVVVEQKGIDVVVRLYAPLGQELANVDTCNGDQGPEPIFWIAETSGIYRLDVLSLSKTAVGGKYEVKIGTLRTGVENDRKLLVAEKAFQSGNGTWCLDEPRSLRPARGKFEEALPLFSAVGAWDREAYTLRYVGFLSYKLGEYQKASEYRARAVSIYKAKGDLRNEMTTLVLLGEAFFAAGELQKASDSFSDALKLSEKMGDKHLEAETLALLGRTQFSISLPKAIEYYGRALAASRSVGYASVEADVLYSRGNAYTITGEIQKGLEDYKQALSIFRKWNSIGGKARTLNSMAFAFLFLGENQKALDVLTEALPLIKSFGNKSDIAATLSQIGSAYEASGANEKALAHYAEALAVARQSGDKNRESTILANTGWYYFRVGEASRALEYYNQALSLGLDSRVQAQVLINAGTAYDSLGKRQSAVEYYQKSLAVSRSVLFRRGEASALDRLQSVWSRMGKPRVAIFYGKQSVNKYQELRRYVDGLDKETQKTYLKTFENAYRRLADMLISEGRFGEAQQVLAMLKEEEYFAFVRRDANEIKNLKNRVTLTPAEQNLIERYDLLAGVITAIGAEYERIARKKNQLPSGQSLPAAEQKRFDELTIKIEDANAAFRLFLENELAAELGKQRKSDVEADRSLLEKLSRSAEGTVALYTVAGEDRYRVILTTPTVQVDGKSDIRSADLNKKIFAFREALRNPSIDPRPLGKDLYDSLIKPIEKYLEAANAKTLIWSLDGALRYIPIAALSPDGKSYLIEKYRSVVVTSATRQDLTSKNETDWRTLGVGVSTAQTVPDPTLPGESIPFMALPGVRTELTKIVRDELLKTEKGLFAGRRLIDDDFNTKTFGDLLTKEMPDGKRKYSIVHIASHFRLGDNSANSFLLLGGGNTLTLQQISNSPQMSFGGVELVTLSACNTAFGSDDSNGREVDSLAKFIESRGAKAVLATLWSVADESTQLLMGEFYRLHKQNPNITKAEAMQRVQKAMIEGRLKSSNKSAGCRSEKVNINGPKPADFKCDASAPFSHPYYWSPFILIGNWR